MNRTIALFPLALGAFAASVASAQMTVRRTAKAIVVSSSGRPGYRLKLDLTQGGVATQFRIPADGPDVTSDQAGWSGLFGLYVQGGTDGPPPGADAYGERTLVKGDGVLDSARVAVRTPGRIVVDLAGHASGWGTYGRSGERFIDYRNRLTFEADRIVSNGEVTWVCGHDTVPNVIAPVGLFAPNLVQWPIRLIGPDGASHEIPLALDDEAPFPRGLTYPVTAEIWLRGGRCLLIRSLRVPHDWVRHPWLDYERPWLTHWRQSFAFTNNPADRGPVGKPIRYSYEIEIP
ncbi:MAG: hypothetical protein ACREFX_12825, partial [Opitutaceae bacterium]